MSSGESDGRTLTSTLDSWRFCRVEGCDWRVSNGDLCPDHGGSPLGRYRADEWGEHSETHASPAFALVRDSQIVE